MVDILEQIEEQLLDEVKEILSDNKKLVVYNDDVHSFEFVIYHLVKLLKMGLEQAEQCTYIIHHNGKCSVKEGQYDDLKVYREALSEIGLKVLIE